MYKQFRLQKYICNNNYKNILRTIDKYFTFKNSLYYGFSHS